MIGHNPVAGLKPDADGYYTVVLAYPGERAPSGRIYDPVEVTRVFHERMARGPLYVEFGTPCTKGLDYREELSRANTVVEGRVCGVITGGGGVDTVLKGRFKPTGPFGNVVQDMLATEDAELCFGMRSLIWGHQHPNVSIHNFVTFDLIAPPPKEAEVITQVTVAKKPDPVLEVEVRGNLPHIGKSCVMEVIKRALEQNGYTGVKLIKQDNDQPFWDARHDEELRATGSLTTMSITLIDNNQKPVGAKV